MNYLTEQKYLLEDSPPEVDSILGQGFTSHKRSQEVTIFSLRAYDIQDAWCYPTPDLDFQHQ